jgi:signal peptidase I
MPGKKESKSKGHSRPLREVFLFILDILYNAVIIVILVVLIRGFLISPFRVVGSSMADTLINNEFILIDKFSYIIGEPKRGDPIVFLPPITNKYSHKFEGTLETDENGVIEIDISDLSVPKKAFYCQNKLIQGFWFCENKVKVNDLVFFRSTEDADGTRTYNLTWKSAEKQFVTEEEIKNKTVVISGEANKSYSFRIYDSAGPEYFVKRIIGIPGDAVKIENGRVYLKTPESGEFIELDEIYLSEQNQFNTYYKKSPDGNEFLIPDEHYFVLGDNRSHSNDSRHWYTPIEESYMPYVNKDHISGRVLIVLWPPDNLRLISSGALEDVVFAQ